MTRGIETDSESDNVKMKLQIRENARIKDAAEYVECELKIGIETCRIERNGMEETG